MTPGDSSTPQNQPFIRMPAQHRSHHSIEEDFFVSLSYRQSFTIEPVGDRTVENSVWAPLKDLLQEDQLHLTTFTFFCNNLLPHCVWIALRDHRKDCRLYLNNFHLPCMRYPYPDITQMELETTTSPKFCGLTYASSGGDEVHDTIKTLAAGLAPQLQDVTLLGKILFGTLRPEERAKASGMSRPFEKLLPDSLSTERNNRGKLKRLRIADSSSRNTEFLEWCDSIIDSTYLETLALTSTIINMETFQAMSTDMFPSLKTLVLQLGNRYDLTIKSDEYFAAMTSFFRSIPPCLKELRLDVELICPVFKAIIEHHGSRLKKLVIQSPFHFHPDQLIIQSEQACHLNGYCSSLEDLTLTIPRSKGDLKEIAIYKALGALPQLHHLHLILDSSYISEYDWERGDSWADSPMPMGPEFDEFENMVYGGRRSTRVGHLRNALINGALDENLARSIFQSISESKPKDSVRLETLKLDSIVSCVFGHRDASAPSGFQKIAMEISRSWWLERNERDDRRDEVHAMDVTQED